MEYAPLTDDAELLADALEVPPATLALRSREPLSTGSVAGFDVLGGETPLTYYVDTSGLSVAQETGLVLHDDASDAVTARIWLHPADPHLPALAAVAFDHAAESLLSRLGVTAAGETELRAYLPGRRAVLRVPTDEGAMWVKVVRPSRIERIVDAHSAVLAAGIPSPAVRGWSPEGIIVLDEAAGTPAQDVAWEPQVLLDEVDRLRTAMGSVALDVPARGVATRLDWYASRVTGSPGAERVVSGIRQVTDETARGARGTVHGDLHFGQLFLDDAGRISSVIDVDTVGEGLLAEDPAAFLAHASASALLTVGAHESRAWALADEAMRRWGDDTGVRACAATHLLGHAVGASDAAAAERAEALLRVAEAILSGRLPSDASQE